MQVNRDNEAIFRLLEEFERLPADFNSDSTYIFERYGTFFQVVYLHSGQKRDFILFSIEHFSANFRELSDIMVYLSGLEEESDHHEVITEAIAEINSVIQKGGTGTMFFDAH